VAEAKSPDEIFKTVSRGPAAVDSARQNLAATFVNAFVNCGFGSDKLVSPEGSDWLYKNKTHGMRSAAASLGMIMLWDVDTGTIFPFVDFHS
jgi:26S proteasome regulatory subunit N1